ncbi:MAG: copper resistance CopC/CopD family protein [Natronosporangium sp.]
MRRWVLVATAVVVAVLATAGPASAHATLLVTTPLADGAVAEPPSHVELVFNERVVVHEVALRDAAGKRYPLGAASLGGGGRAVMVPVEAELPTGAYAVRWEVTGTDGDRHGDEFRFAVGAAVVAPGTSIGGLDVAWGSAGLRALLFAALAVALGGLVGQWLVAGARAVNPELPEVSSWLPVATLAGAGAAVGLAVPLAGQLLGSTPGRVLLAELVGFAAAAGLVALRRPMWAVVPLLAVVAAEGIRSHAQTSQPGWGAVLTGLHLAAVAVWVGALLHVVRAGWAWRASRAAVWWLVSGYSRLALWLAAGVVAAGVVLALLLVPLDALTSTSYGRTLLVKLGLVITAVALAATGRWLLRRRRDPARLARTATAEASVLVVVLAVSGVLTATPPAGQQSTHPPPPPPVGPVQPIGTMAGQLGLALAASDGQLVVRVSTPRLGDYYDVPADRTFTLGGRLAPADGEPVTVDFRACGDDCFVAGAGWAEGDNLLTLRADAEGWRGGEASVVVPWPVTAIGDQELGRVVGAMDRAGEFTVVESISSDTSRPMPEPAPLPIDAGTFLSDEPYGTGVAPQGVVLPDDGGDGRMRLRLGFPAERRFAELVVDTDGRILSEVLTGPKHVIRRSFLYQDQ